MTTQIKSHRMVQDPSMSDAEYYHQRSIKTGPNVGKVLVEENPMSRIGALCYISHRAAVQEKAAEMFKAMYESLYGAQPAVDLANPIVDRTIIAHDSGMAARVDRSHRMDQALKTLGRTAFNRIVASVCMGISFRDYHWRKRKEEVQALLDSLDTLAEIWHLGRKKRDSAA